MSDHSAIEWTDATVCTHQWQPYGFVLVDGGLGITPAERCGTCGVLRYAPESPHFGQANQDDVLVLLEDALGHVVVGQPVLAPSLGVAILQALLYLVRNTPDARPAPK